MRNPSTSAHPLEASRPQRGKWADGAMSYYTTCFKGKNYVIFQFPSLSNNPLISIKSPLNLCSGWNPTQHCPRTSCRRQHSQPGGRLNDAQEMRHQRYHHRQWGGGGGGGEYNPRDTFSIYINAMVWKASARCNLVFFIIISHWYNTRVSLV